MSGLIRFLGLFIKIDPHMILFNSFGGRKYDDSPQAIFLEMCQDARFDQFKLIWAIDDPLNADIPERATVVKDYTFSFFVYALKAKVWITNSSIEHGLYFKKKNTVYINTWHGSAIKYLGEDVREKGKSFKSKKRQKENAFFTQSEYDEYVFAHAFKMDKSIFKRFGLPRNDELVQFSEEKIEQIKDSLGIEDDRKIILYAATFREYSRSTKNKIVQSIKIDLTKWEKEFGDRFVLLIRAHYEVAEMSDISFFRSVKNVSGYPHLNDLLIISDALISDYSSIFFDYSILHRPMFCFAYDFEEYAENRGMYINIEKELPCRVARTDNELFREIEDTFSSYQEKCEKTVEFQKKYVTEYGSAAQKACDYIAGLCC